MECGRTTSRTGRWVHGGCLVTHDRQTGRLAQTGGARRPQTEAFWGKGVRFEKVAEGFECYGEFVEREEDIGPAIERALASGRPGVIQVPVDHDANAMDAPNYEEFKSWYTDFKAGYGAEAEDAY